MGDHVPEVIAPDQSLETSAELGVSKVLAQLYCLVNKAVPIAEIR